MRPLTHRFSQQSSAGLERAAYYTTFGKYFIETFGQYCMACEAPLSTDMQVDHRLGRVLSRGESKTGRAEESKKKRAEEKESEVDELLGYEKAQLFRESESFETAFMALCPKCNGCKNRGISPAMVVGTDNPSAPPKRAAGSILWPDFDNTFLAFQYQESGEVSVDEEAIRRNIAHFYVAAEIPQKSKVESVILRARRTIELYNWNGSPSALNKLDAPRYQGTRSSARNEQPEATVSRFSEASDLRKLNRGAAYQRATAAMARYAALDAGEEREVLWQQIADTIIATGYWSLWLGVFGLQEDQATRAELCGKMFESPITDHFKSTSTCVAWDSSKKALIFGRAPPPEKQVRGRDKKEASTEDYLALFEKQLPMEDVEPSVSSAAPRATRSPEQDDRMDVDPPVRTREIVSVASLAPAPLIRDARRALKRGRSDEVDDDDEAPKKRARTEVQRSQSPVLPRDAVANAPNILSVRVLPRQRNQSSAEDGYGGVRPTTRAQRRKGGGKTPDSPG